jgi:hypothetical protein
MRASDIHEIIKLSTPESHMEELDRRLKTYGSPPGTLLSLEELRTTIERRK